MTSKLFDEELLDTISKNIKECGFKYVTLDLQGYRVGSFNETIMKNSDEKVNKNLRRIKLVNKEKKLKLYWKGLKIIK